MFGDRLDTDIAFGIECGIKTVLTMTGITNKEMLTGSPIQPDCVIETFCDLL